MKQRDPFAFQNQEDALDMDPCFAFSKQGCNGEGSSRSEQSGKTTKRIALVLREEHKSLSRIESHHRFRRRDLVEIQTRLAFLEEERSTMEKVLFECVNERKRLIDEVYQQFQQIDTSLLSASVTAYSPKVNMLFIFYRVLHNTKLRSKLKK